MYKEAEIEYIGLINNSAIHSQLFYIIHLLSKFQDILG